MKLKDGSRCLFICTCDDMCNTRRFLEGLDLSTLTSAEVSGQHYCTHSAALHTMHDNGALSCVSMVDEAARARFSELSFTGRPLSVVSTKQPVVLSCAFGDCEDQLEARRVFISADKVTGHYRCQSCAPRAQYSCHHIAGLESLLEEAAAAGLEHCSVRPRKCRSLSAAATCAEHRT